MKSEKKTTEGFTRFSATASIMWSALFPEKKVVIDSYRFGSLPMFNKCFVSNKFAKWAVRLVDCKSGDIIHAGKVISLTKELVHLVLDLPTGRRAFPSDRSAGMDVVLFKFGKQKIPPVCFFANKLIKKEDLSHEDLFICFMLIVLSSFLCSNSNIVSSPNILVYSKILSTSMCLIGVVMCYNGCFIISKHSNRGKNEKVRRYQALGGCIYYLVVSFFFVNCKHICHNSVLGT